MHFPLTRLKLSLQDGLHRTAAQLNTTVTEARDAQVGLAHMALTLQGVVEQLRAQHQQALLEAQRQLLDQTHALQTNAQREAGQAQASSVTLCSTVGIASACTITISIPLH